MLYRLFHLDLRVTEDRNAWYLCVEIFWASILGTAAAFSSAYALRLGATNAEIGLLSSIPALLAIFVSVPAGRFLQSRERRAPWYLASLLIHRTAYLFLPFIPYIQIPGISQGLLLVLWLVTISIWATFFNIGFIPMLADVIPERRRAGVFSARNMINNASVSVLTLLVGVWLKRIIFPLNYQLMFFVGYIAGMLSQYYLYRLDIPDGVVQPQTESQKSGLKVYFQALHQSIIEKSEFYRITRNTFLHAFGLWVIAPLYIIYFVRQLGADEGWLGINGMVSSVTTIASFAFWRWLILRISEPRTLKISIMGVGLYPLLVGLSPSLVLILGATALNSFFAAGTSLSHLNTLLKCFPEDRRTQFYSFYTIILNAGAFVAPLIGVALANQFGIVPILVVCGLLVLLGSSTFIFWPVQVQK